jgi:hypothetical protein
MILASDIGGTHTRLAFFSAEGERPKSLVEDIFLKRAVKKASSIWNPLGLDQRSIIWGSHKHSCLSVMKRF